MPSRHSSGISIDITGREDVVSRLKEEMLDIIAGMHPKYEVMYRINFAVAAWITYIIPWFVFMLLLSLRKVMTSKWITLLGANRDIINSLASC